MQIRIEVKWNTKSEAASYHTFASICLLLQASYEVELQFAIADKWIGAVQLQQTPPSQAQLAHQGRTCRKERYQNKSTSEEAACWDSGATRGAFEQQQQS